MLFRSLVRWASGHGPSLKELQYALGPAEIERSRSNLSQFIQDLEDTQEIEDTQSPLTEDMCKRSADRDSLECSLEDLIDSLEKEVGEWLPKVSSNFI